jgi:large subunit ribosomal protein L3
MTAILGKKLGMTQIFSGDGNIVDVTAIEAGPCPILAVKDESLQLGFEEIKESKLRKPVAGYFKKIKVSPRKFIREIKKDTGVEYQVGQELKVDQFKEGDLVDVTGISKGKGFQGGMKRWHWHGGPMTHGSMSHRRVGSIGSTTTPGRVWRGHHMPGHMGNKQATLLYLKVAKVDAENNLLLLKGAVPGGKNSYLVIRKSRKQKIAVAAKGKKEVKVEVRKKK